MKHFALKELSVSYRQPSSVLRSLLNTTDFFPLPRKYTKDPLELCEHSASPYKAGDLCAGLNMAVVSLSNWGL